MGFKASIFKAKTTLLTESKYGVSSNLSVPSYNCTFRYLILHSHGDIIESIYHADNLNSLHQAHSLHVTARVQDIRAEASRPRLRPHFFAVELLTNFNHVWH